MRSKRGCLLLIGLSLAISGALILKGLIVAVGVFMFAYGFTLIFLSLHRDLKRLFKKLEDKAKQ